MENLADIGATIQRVIDAAQYLVDYSLWLDLNVDFQTLYNRNDRSPPKAVPSQMRELNCASDFAWDSRCNGEWDLYAAA